jgi:hypothetical protein
MKSDTKALVGALRVLAREIYCEDGCANAVCAEAADRLEVLDGIVAEVTGHHRKKFETLTQIGRYDEAAYHADREKTVLQLLPEIGLPAQHWFEETV